MRIRLFKLAIVILAATFSGAGVRAQQQTPDQSSQDQQKKQDQQQNSNQGAQPSQAPDQQQQQQTNQDQQQQPQQQQQQQNPDQQQNPNQGAQPPQNPDENQPQQPIPAYRSPLGGTIYNEDDNIQTSQYERDTAPLSGVEDVSAGTLRGERRSSWSPYLSVLVSGQSSSLGGAHAGWRSYESVVGGLNFRKVSRESDFDVRYLGGGSFYSSSGVGDTVVQDLGVTERLHWRRNSLVLVDQFGYFPEASFGYGGGLGLPGLTTTTSILQPVFVPGESILTTAGARATNSSLAQLDIGLSARSSFTIAGGYSFLKYFDTSLFDYSDIIARAGYNYRVTRQNTIALFYNFDELRYSGFTATIQNHTVNASFGRQMTGRLSFQAAAGPEVSFYPASLVGGASTNSISRVSWSMHTSLNYRQQERTTLGVSYSHGVSGGSGVFFGARTDRITGSLNYQPSRGALRFSGGYAHNKGLTAPGVTSVQTYNYWFGGATYARSVSRTWNLSLGYELQYQESNLVFCITTPCGRSFTRNIVSLGLNWNARPMAF